MIDLIIDSIMSVKHSINSNNVTPCFELFGYDFMIDEDFRVWLIEINTNPFLGTPNKDMVVLVPKMIDEMFSLVVDNVFEPLIQPII
jgi:hypothetical protein